MKKFLGFVAMGAVAASLIMWALEPIIAGIVVIAVVVNADQRGWLKP